MDALTRQRIVRALDKAPSDNELAKYLFQVANRLTDRAVLERTLSMREGIESFLDESKPLKLIELQDGIFSDLSEFFFLTPGLHIVSAPSGHGKTLWGMEWATQTAMDGGEALWVSLEMTPKDMASRIVASVSGLPLIDIVRDGLGSAQKDVLRGVIDQNQHEYLRRIHVDHMGNYDWVKIYPRLWDRMLKLKPRLVIVDYVQMIYDSNETDSRQSKVLGDVARDLKLLADTTGCAVILISQTNRSIGLEIRKSKWTDLGYVPMSNEFVKESGGIVEAADSVQMICIPERFSGCPLEFKNYFQVLVDKSRRLGPLGVVKIPFDTEKMKFERKGFQKAL